MKDEQIIALYFERSQDAITESEKKYGGYCFSIAHRILSSKEDAEECVNDTWHTAWCSMPPQKPQFLSSFLARITRNSALDRLAFLTADKRRGATLMLMEELAEALPGADADDEMTDALIIKDAINSFLRSLSEKKRNIFLQRYFYCLSVKEIAEGFSMSENHVAVILRRTRNALRAHLEAHGIVL